MAVVDNGTGTSPGEVDSVGEQVPETAVEDGQAPGRDAGCVVVGDPRTHIGLLDPDILDQGIRAPVALEGVEGVTADIPRTLDVEICHHDVVSIGIKSSCLLSLCGVEDGVEVGEVELRFPHSTSL